LLPYLRLGHCTSSDELKQHGAFSQSSAALPPQQEAQVLQNLASCLQQRLQRLAPVYPGCLLFSVVNPFLQSAYAVYPCCPPMLSTHAVHSCYPPMLSTVFCFLPLLFAHLDTVYPFLLSAMLMTFSIGLAALQNHLQLKAERYKKQQE